MLLARGCDIDLDGLVGRRRRAQAYLAPHLSSEQEDCSWDQIDDFAKQVDAMCCGDHNAGCPGGVPPTECSAACAVTIHTFTSECSETLAVILEPDDAFRASIGAFEGQVWEHSNHCETVNQPTVAHGSACLCAVHGVVDWQRGVLACNHGSTLP